MKIEEDAYLKYFKKIVVDTYKTAGTDANFSEGWDDALVYIAATVFGMNIVLKGYDLKPIEEYFRD